jgi:hypothetical protein
MGALADAIDIDTDDQDRPREGRPPKLNAHSCLQSGSRGERTFGLHARGSGAYLQGDVRQEPARNLDGPHRVICYRMGTATAGMTGRAAQARGLRVGRNDA